MDHLEIGKVLWQQHIQSRLFAMDAEGALDTILDLLEQAGSNPMILEQIEYLCGSHAADAPVSIGNQKRQMIWRNSVGIPAGFTKLAFGLVALDKMRPGAIEVGTCVPELQPGNLQPRFFIRYNTRDDVLALVNRFGFNHTGIREVTERVQRVWMTQGRDRIKATLIWSLGPNKKTVDKYEETRELRLIADDILYMVAEVLPVLRESDAFQFNIASPNTPGLRDLFAHFENLLVMIMEKTRTLAEVHRKQPPVWIIKLSPDMDYEQMRQVTRAAASYEEIVALEGFNTTVNDGIKAQYNLTEAGGVSGDPLRQLAQEKLVTLHRIIEEENLDIDLIGLGGITYPKHAVERLSVGPRVKAIQVFSGIFKYGFTLIPDTLKAIAKAM